jgi:N4-gp56 family major capsid protein
MLPTDELIRKATTTTTQLTKLIPQLWAAQIERNLRKQAVFEQSAVVNTDLLVPGAGDTVYIPILPDLGAAGQLTEGTDMSITTLSTATSVALVPVEYGVTVEVTRKALDRIKYDGAAAVMDRLSYSMSQAINVAFANLYNASVPGTSNKMTKIYANGKTTSTITSSDTFNDALILSGIQTLQQANNVPFPDNYWRLYINPAQWAALLQDTNTRQDLRWAAPERLLTGEVGTLHGCRIIVTNYIQTSAEGSGGAVTVNNAMLVAPRWSVIAYKRKPEAVVDPTLYDMGRRRRFGITADFDIELLHNERGVVLASA